MKSNAVEWDVPPPAGRDLDAWLRWVWSELGIHADVVALPEPVMGIARLVEHGSVRGVVSVSDRAEYPLYVLAHEVGHLMTGACYEVDCVVDERSWTRVPAEREATEYGCRLLIDEDWLMARLDDGRTLEQLAWKLGVPIEAVTLRMRQMGLVA